MTPDEEIITPTDGDIATPTSKIVKDVELPGSAMAQFDGLDERLKQLHENKKKREDLAIVCKKVLQSHQRLIDGYKKLLEGVDGNDMHYSFYSRKVMMHEFNQELLKMVAVYIYENTQACVGGIHYRYPNVDFVYDTPNGKQKSQSFEFVYHKLNKKISGFAQWFTDA